MTAQPETQKVTTQTEMISVHATPIAWVGERDLIREMAARVKLLVFNGKMLNDNEALALAQYSVANDLNPMIGEAYYIPNVGPTPGIAGWRKKAMEVLRSESLMIKNPGVINFWCEYEDNPPEIATKPGDIAVKAILHDSLTRQSWEQRKLSYFIQLTGAGVKDNAWQMAGELVGDEPTWSACAVVRAGEDFGARENFDRRERACKRAEKLALRKRFPSVNLPEPAVSPEDFIDVEPTMGMLDAPDPEPPEEHRVATDQILRELGYS